MGWLRKPRGASDTPPVTLDEQWSLSGATPSEAEGSSVDDPAIVTLIDALRPIAWSVDRYHVDFGDYLARSQVVLRFPAEAYTNFLFHYFRLPYSRRLSWWINPLESHQVLSKLNRRLQGLQAQLQSDALHRQVGDPATAVAFEDAHELRQRLARQETRMYTVSCVITILTDGADAESRVLARRRENELFQSTQTTLWILRNASFEQAPAFFATTPIGRPAYQVPQELDSETVALMFPFIGGDVMEPHGLLFGMNPTTAAPVMVDWYNRSRYPSNHMVVIAKTRSGKSTTMKFIVGQHLLRDDTEAIILDPSLPIDYQAFSTRFGAYIRLRPGGEHIINPFEIRWPSNLAKLDPEDRKLRDRKIEFLVPLLGLLLHPELEGRWPDPFDRAYVESICNVLYDQFEITNDPMSILAPETLNWKTPEYRRMPTFSDLSALLKAQPDPLGPRLATILEPAIRGSLAVFNGQTNVNLDQRLITFNIESLTGGSRQELVSIIHYVVAEMVAQRMLTNNRRKMILLDEAHILFRNRETAAWTARLYRMAAKSNAQVVLITQGLHDLLGDSQNGVVVEGADMARVCLQNSSFRLLLHHDSTFDLNLMEQEFHLSPSERAFIEQPIPEDAQDRPAVLATERYHVPFYVVIPESLRTILSSDPHVQPVPDIAQANHPLADRVIVSPGQGRPE